MSMPIESLAGKYQKALSEYFRFGLQIEDEYVRILSFASVGTARERTLALSDCRELSHDKYEEFRTFSGFAVLGENEYLTMVGVCADAGITRKGESLSPVVITTDFGFVLQFTSEGRGGSKSRGVLASHLGRLFEVIYREQADFGIVWPKHSKGTQL